jgi:hypothetical protein
MEKRLDCQVWVQVTDFDLHQMWLHPGITGYFVANEELAFRLHRQGVPRKDIVVSGIPVMPVFNYPSRSTRGSGKTGTESGPLHRTADGRWRWHRHGSGLDH